MLLKFNTRINIGLRLNPNVDALTIKEITTGKQINKFGLSDNEVIEFIKLYKNSKLVSIKCLSVHIGSQITSVKPFKNVLSVIDNVISKTKINFKYIDLGGGMSIPYSQSEKLFELKQYARLVNKFSKNNSGENNIF